MAQEFEDDDSGIKQLRKAHDELVKKLKEKDDLLSEFVAEKRKSSVAELLTAKGVNAKVAALYNGDPTEDAVGKWVAEYADVFGAVAPLVDDPAAADKRTAVLDGARAVAAADRAGGDTEKQSSTVSALKAAKNMDELMEVIQRGG